MAGEDLRATDDTTRCAPQGVCVTPSVLPKSWPSFELRLEMFFKSTFELFEFLDFFTFLDNFGANGPQTRTNHERPRSAIGGTWRWPMR